jgi:hypothetical protein
MNDPSGLSLAEEAHAAGAVEPTLVLPNVQVRLEFIVRGTPQHADAIAGTLAAELSARSDVAHGVTYSVGEAV